MRDLKPIASLSIDLDNKWSYMKTHGDPGWESFPSYLDVVVPRVVGFLADRGLTITFFVVGQDAALARNHDSLRLIVEAGHEIGNHSFHHEPWLHLYSEAEIVAEFEQAEEAIISATGRLPLGFRGPGFSLSRTTLEILERRGYLYDASTFPTFLGPLARCYYFMTSRHLSAEERGKRKALFGTFREGFRSLKPYRWNVGDRSLIEIPVTTMPLFRVPIHLSYLLYLACFSPRLASTYIDAALRLCRLTGVGPSFLLHPLDFLGRDDVGGLDFFPAMNLPAERKLSVVDTVFSLLTSRFRVVTMAEHARTINEIDHVPVVAPSFTAA